MYNSEKYIEKTIFSILSQEEHGLNYEIIIVDDVSKDNSCEIVKNLKNDKIKLIELKQNRGTANARNEGIKLARGEWIQFVDSDDRICNDLYKKFELSRKPDINCYLFSVIFEYKYNIIKKTITYIYDKRAFGYFGVIWNKFIKRDICMEFKKDYSFEDACFIIDMMIEKDLKISLIDNAYYLYNCNNDQSKMANFNKKEYKNMFDYTYSQIDKCDDLTKLFILDKFVGILFANTRPFFMSLYFAIKTAFKLFKYVPGLFGDKNKKYILTSEINK